MRSARDLPAAPARARDLVGFTVRLAEELCERVAQGESVAAICEAPHMPSRRTVARWMAAKPNFRQAMLRARTAGGRAPSGQALATYSETVAGEIFQRMCEGEAVTAICADPQMPCFSTVYLWRRRVPAFAEAMRIAREVQAERFCDLGWALAGEATPETAYLTEVRLRQLRWTASALAPRTYGPRKATAPDEGDGTQGGFTVVVKRFTDAPDPDLDGAVLAPGEQRVLRQGTASGG